MSFITHKQAIALGDLPNHPTHRYARNPVINTDIARKLKGLPEIIYSEVPPWDIDEGE